MSDTLKGTKNDSIVQEVKKMDQSTVSSIMKGMGEIVPKDTSIAIADNKRFIFYQPSKKVDLKIRPGDAINEETVTYKALTVQQRIAEQKGKHVFGVPYYGISIPILENGKPNGCVTAILPHNTVKFSAPFLTVRTMDRWLPISYEEIIYLEAENRKTVIQSSKGKGTHKFNLSELESMLPKDIFMRCHRSYMININQIAEIHPDSHSTFLLIMKDMSKVPVSQTYASRFRNILCF